jgi:hypothetical protein
MHIGQKNGLSTVLPLMHNQVRELSDDFYGMTNHATLVFSLS